MSNAAFALLAFLYSMQLVVPTIRLFSRRYHSMMVAVVADERIVQFGRDRKRNGDWCENWYA